MRWLVAGGTGLLGTEAVLILRSRGYSVIAPSRADLDITDPHSCTRAAADADVVLNCAGWTAVDAAEGSEGLAFAANGLGAAYLARGAHASGARIVQISTDYVFDGRARTPYSEDALVSPQSAYGRSKAAGEWAAHAENPEALVVRTAWLYGEHGPCFPKTIVARAKEKGRLNVVDDQWGQPTWTADVVNVLVRLVEGRAPAGTYHVTASGSTTWFAFTEEILAAAGCHDVELHAVTSDSYPMPAARPAYSVLGHSALHRVGVTPIGDWRQRWTSAADRVLA